MARRGAALILLNGELGAARTVLAAARRAALVLCADGGTRHAARLGLRPHVVVGDMDSLPPRLPRWRQTAFLCDFDPDCSDFGKALRFVTERGFAEAWVAGGWGGGIDHALVNIALAESYAERLAVRFLGEPQAELVGPGLHRFRLRKGQRLTLLALAPGCSLASRGLSYPLRGEVLERGSRGLANRASASEVSLRVRSGRAWVIF